MMSDRIKPEELTLKAEELRIGNWVLFAGKPKQMTGNDIAFLWMDQNSDKLASAIHEEPIPLSKDWLERFDWGEIINKPIDKTYRKVAPNENEYYVTFEAKKGWTFWIGSVILTRIEFVHDLQNVWHSLTSTELQLKEPQV